MLYKKRFESEISDDLFKNPTSEYRAAPFWAWNTELERGLLEKEIEILVELHSGDAAATAWGCDLTYDYVRINGDYRT